MSAGPLRIASSDVCGNASININKNTVDNEIATTQRIVVTASYSNCHHRRTSNHCNNSTNYE